MVSEAYKLALAEQRAKQKLALQRVTAQKQIAVKRAGGVSSRFAGLKQLRVAPQLSQEQAMLGEMFGSGITWGTGESLPIIRGELRSGYGLINTGSGDDTAEMFGLS